MYVGKNILKVQCNVIELVGTEKCVLTSYIDWRRLPNKYIFISKIKYFSYIFYQTRCNKALVRTKSYQIRLSEAYIEEWYLR